MDGFSRALWFWLPVLIFKTAAFFLNIIWKLNLWILQTISGVPLYYCKPHYRIPGIFVGTLGVIICLNILLFLLLIGVTSSSDVAHHSASMIRFTEFFIIGIIGLSCMFMCRVLIRIGSI